jgi:hypothetical protein
MRKENQKYSQNNFEALRNSNEFFSLNTLIKAKIIFKNTSFLVINEKYS